MEQQVPPYTTLKEETTAQALKKLSQEILQEQINKRSYSSAEESESDDDSDTELLMKFVPKKKSGKIEKTHFDSVGYAFQLSIKISKLRSELARTEERMRYLQLDYNNKIIEIENLKDRVTRQLENIKEKNETIRKNEKALNFAKFPHLECQFYRAVLFFSLIFNLYYYFYSLVF
jgi:hypothetical protein